MHAELVSLPSLFIFLSSYQSVLRLPPNLAICTDDKVSVYNAGDLGSIPGSGRFPGE